MSSSFLIFKIILSLIVLALVILWFILPEMVTPTGLIAGKVLYPAAPAELVGVQVSLLKDGAAVQSVMVDAQGGFLFTPVPYGDYVILAGKTYEDGRVLKGMMAIKLDHPEQMDVEVTLERELIRTEAGN
ncbi:hypothetical protein CCP3SC15_6120002 [Gammaproteobacteria bacterium]